MKKFMTFLAVIAFTGITGSLLSQDFYTGAAEPDGYQGSHYSNTGTREWTGCLPCALPEGEADIPDDGDDVTNGGCNYPPPLFTDIQIGDVFCGRGNGYLVGGAPFRDTDWYRLELAESKTMYFTGIANFNCVFFIVDGICDAPSVVASVIPTPGAAGTCSATIGPGTFVFFVAPNGFGPEPGLTGDYMMYVSDVPPQEPWCTDQVPLSNWALGIGILLILAFAVIRLRRF